jgi:hypothetical protein
LEVGGSNSSYLGWMRQWDLSIEHSRYLPSGLTLAAQVMRYPDSPGRSRAK